jgi:hypothetical protein
LREALEHGLDLETALGLAKDADFNTLHGDPRFEILVTKAKPRRVHRTERSIRALATSPTWTVLRAAPPSGRTRAAEGIRTLDPELGKLLHGRSTGVRWRLRKSVFE